MKSAPNVFDIAITLLVTESIAPPPSFCKPVIPRETETTACEASSTLSPKPSFQTF
nr:hypothetical protein [Bacillus cereus]